MKTITYEEAKAQAAKIKEDLMKNIDDETWNKLPSDKKWEIIEKCGGPVAEYTEQQKKIQADAGFADNDNGYLHYLFDQSVKAIEEERDRYKVALEEIIQLDGKFGRESVDIAKQVLEIKKEKV